MAHYLLKELEEKLRTDNDIWDFLRVSCLDGLWYWDLEHPEHEWMSPEFWRLFGHDPATKEHSPDSWQDIIFPDDLKTAVDNFERHVADPAWPYDQIVRYRHARGHTIWVRCRGLAIRDAQGKAVRMLGAHTDLTPLVTQVDERERVLKQANARLSAVFNAAHSGIVGLDAARNVVMLNPPARHILGGLSIPTPFPWPAEIRFLQAEDLRPLDASSDPINRALSGLQLGGEVHLMSRARDREPTRYVRVSSAHVDEPGSDVHTVVILDDVSEQERNRQQIERKSRLDALGQLTGGIAHDFNNLLATILYAVNLARKEQQSDRSRRLLDGALSSVERGRDLTGRLLAFAKRQPTRPTSRPIADILEEFHALVRPTIEERIELRLDPVKPGLAVYCDVAQLENALLNLVLNSRDAIMRGGKGGRITVGARELTSLQGEDELPYLAARIDARSVGTAEHRFVEVMVTDDGPGMPEEVRRRATDPFFTTKDTNSGTGLGLSIVYGFVQQSDGIMQIYSEAGTGTTVRLVLPSGGASGERSAPQERPEAERGRGETILLVEDEVVLLSMMSETLTELGYRVVPADTGVAAWQRIEDGLDFDVLISDVVMPGGIGGFELAKRVRQQFPGRPVILLSGYTGYTAEERGGAEVVVLQKPCMPEDLARHLRASLDARVVAR